MYPPLIRSAVRNGCLRIRLINDVVWIPVQIFPLCSKEFGQLHDNVSEKERKRLKQGALCWGFKSSSMATRTPQNYKLFRPRNTQVALKPVEVHIRSRPWLFFMFTCPSIKKKKQFRVSRYEAAKLYLVSMNNVTLFSSLSTNMFSLSGSINMLFTFFFSQSSWITMFPNDPYSYLVR